MYLVSVAVSEPLESYLGGGSAYAGFRHFQNGLGCGQEGFTGNQGCGLTLAGDFGCAIWA